MCGIAGIADIHGRPVPDLSRKLAVMNELLAHRGPDDEGTWVDPAGAVGLAHRRLTIIDLSDAGHQPMRSERAGTTLTYNGEIYNYVELRAELESRWDFASTSDSETILAAYDRHGTACLDHLRGMFSFAIWDEREQRLFCARDRFGIKPFFYTVVDGMLVFASELKALLPFVGTVETDPEALAEYFTFQFSIGEQTLFRGIKTLLPGHALELEGGRLRVRRYWDVAYEVDFDHSPAYFRRRFAELLEDSLAVHLRSDVPVGSYLSGGIDSSLVAMLAAEQDARNDLSFHGKFTEFPGYDESSYAELVASRCGNLLHQVDITADDFRRHIRDVIYHLDFPVAGPGSFPQFMVSKLAAEHVKVVLGGQGGDEILGGYARYLVAYFEQCIKAALDGTYHDGNYVVTIESIVPNLGLLREYKPMIREFWRAGLFGELDERYFRLIDRASDMTDEVDWSLLDRARVYDAFLEIFNNRANVAKEAYFDSMTHFDFKTLLPALLHVEDRMSMAHGLESRVPLLDHPLVEFAATVPADVKFESGNLKYLVKQAFPDKLPAAVRDRRDKMGFPVPLREWFGGELKNLVQEVFGSPEARQRGFYDAEAVLANYDGEGRFSRKTWGLLSLELWHQAFHDRAAEYRALLR